MEFQPLWHEYHEKYSCNTMYIEWTFDSCNMRDKCLKSNVLWVFFISFNSFDIGYFIQPYRIACSMQYSLLTPSTYPGSCKTCFFCIPVFGGNNFLIFPIIYLRVGLRSHLHIHLSDLVNSLISADSCSGWHNYSLWGFFSSFMLCWSVGS